MHTVRSVLSACGTEHIVLHKAKQVYRFAGIATYCLHKEEQAVACTTKERKNIPVRKNATGKGGRNCPDRKYEVRKERGEIAPAQTLLNGITHKSTRNHYLCTSKQKGDV
ncbi:MAG: hypothetical protein WAP53_02165 [Dysgonamonadaceae bacterium]